MSCVRHNKKQDKKYMKSTTIILIFSGLIGLNRCSNEGELKLPTLLFDKNFKAEDSENSKFEINKDTLRTSSISLFDFYTSQFLYKKNY